MSLIRGKAYGTLWSPTDAGGLSNVVALTGTSTVDVFVATPVGYTLELTCDKD